MALACAAVGDATAWCLLALVVGVANAKVGAGVAVTAGALVYVMVMLVVVRPLIVRFAYRARDAATLGTLMNTRGLMELIVLNIGLDLGVISPALFAIMVIMALVTTMATSPVLAVIVPNRR